MSEENYRAAAAALGTDVRPIKALARVDPDNAAFDALGRPAMVFDSRRFHRYTRGRFESSRSRLSNPRGVPPSLHYELLDEAYDRDPIAALTSAAWGRFHVLGSNYRAAGCTTVNQLVLAIAQSEAAHLTSFVSVVRSNHVLMSALRANDRASFARHYDALNS